MKKIFTLFALLLIVSFSNAQSNIVTGTVTDCLGAPVAGHPVYISCDSTVTVYYNTVYTNASGVYADTVPYNTFLGGIQPIYIATADIAPGTGWYYFTENPSSSGNTYINDFSINCATSSACSVSFYSYEDSTGVNDTTYLVMNLTAASPGSTTVAWDFGDGSTATGAVNTHIYALNGIYYVCVTIFDASDSCTATYCDNVADIFRSGFVLKTIYVGASLASIDETKLTDVKVYPNPVQNEVFISSPNLEKAKSIVVYDMTGRPVSITNNQSVSNSTSINTSSLENGSYLLVLVDETNNPLYTHPLIKY